MVLDFYKPEHHRVSNKIIAPIRAEEDINQLELKIKTRKLLKAREIVSGSVATGFSFEFDWLRVWRELSTPIREQSEGKPKKSRITFDAQLKIARIIC